MIDEIDEIELIGWIWRARAAKARRAACAKRAGWRLRFAQGRESPRVGIATIHARRTEACAADAAPASFALPQRHVRACAKALESLVQPMFGIMSARLRGYSNSPTIECSMPVITQNSP
ncbi:hypothetical protein [Paraburkholderia sp.]|uniref:hypothetical protein n=1 Tax=Paraburkholderia sp. TaxID=1926495 RepID=UPI00286EC645|nr:hypothetical protein [Paraburkholderia sp.]